MSDLILAAAIGSVAPTGASLLAYASSRAARRDNRRNNLAGLTATVEGLQQSMQRTEATSERIEAAVAGLRERVAHVEGRLDGTAHPVATVDRAKA